MEQKSDSPNEFDKIRYSLKDSSNMNKYKSGKDSNETNLNGKDMQQQFYQLNYFKDIGNIRWATKGSFKDLGTILDERKGRVPIFGYAPFNFSPTSSKRLGLSQPLYKKESDRE